VALQRSANYYGNDFNMSRIVADEDLAAFASQHGYTFIHVMRCLVSHTDDGLPVLDEDCLRQASFNSTVGEQTSELRFGPGTELSKLLKKIGIEPTPTCACRAKAAQMDAWGADECSKPERIEEVVAVMREEAKARGLPFIDAVGRMLVKRAIHNARKATIR
jgi:hypothetical protein